MDITTTYAFVNSTDYTYDSLKLIIADNTVRLRLETSAAYYTDNPSVLTNTKFRTNSISALVESSTKSSSSQIKYTISKDGTPYWWSGTAWVVSNDTYAQANTSSDVNTNIASLLTVGTDVKLKMFLHSETGSTTPILTKVTVTHNYNPELPTLTNSLVWSYLRDIHNPISGALIRCTPSWVIDDSIIISGTEVSTTSLADGFWSINLSLKTTKPDYLTWVIQNKTIRTNCSTGIVKFSELTIID